MRTLTKNNLIGMVEGNPPNEPETKPSEQVHRELGNCGQEVEPSLTTSKKGTTVPFFNLKYLYVMRLINVVRELLVEYFTPYPIVDVNMGKNRIKFIMTVHAQERMTRKENDSDITIDEIKNVITEALPKIEYKAFFASKRGILGPVINGEILNRDRKSGMVVKKPGQEFFIIKKDTGLQINCKVLNFNKNKGELEIIIKTLMKSHTENLNLHNHHRNTLHLNIIETDSKIEDVMVIYV